MKITKEKLRQMILEEMSASKDEAMDFEKEKLTGTAAKKQTRAGADDLLADLTPQERNIVVTLQKKLTAAAKAGNIATGQSLRLMKLLVKELDKLTK